MKKTKSLLLTLVLFFICGNIFPSEVTWDALRCAPLKGITRLVVSIEELNDEAEKIGLTQDRLKTVTELRLRKEGIQIVVDKKEYSKTLRGLNYILNTPVIYINANICGQAFNVSVEMHDNAILRRDGAISCRATTWDTAVTGTYGRTSKAPEYIVSALTMLLDKFINDYYTANPKSNETNEK